jgi:hypothetical protein
VLVDAQSCRLPVGGKTEAIEAGMPHTLDHQIVWPQLQASSIGAESKPAQVRG